MKTLKLILCFSLAIVFSACEDKPLETIYSDIDGQEYYKDMSSDMNVRKATRLILENKQEQVPNDIILSIADSLITDNKKWKIMYFDAFSQVIYRLNDRERAIVSPALFAFFIRNPIEYKSKIDQLSYNKSDILLEIISNQVSESLVDDQITINSIINLTFSYCKDCSQQELDFIVSYVQLAEKLIVE